MKQFTINPDQYDLPISIILPTRNRISTSGDGGLIAALESLYINTINKENTEIILRIDDDDVNTLNNIHLLDKYDKAFKMKLLKGSRYGGYVDIWKFWNELAEEAVGEFLVPFSDDTIMETYGWDKILMEHSGKIGFVKSSYTESISPDINMVIPCIHSKIIELQGYMSFHEAMDKHHDLFVEYAKEKGYNFIIEDDRITFRHIGLQGEHVKDGLPPTDVGGIFRYRDKIESDVQRVINALEVANT
jgi:hypothetical protein